MSKDEIRLLLERLGQAMSDGAPGRVSACWEVPALILLEDGGVALTNAGDIEEMMGQASREYRSQGVVSTRPEIEHIEPLSEKLVSVDVRWPGFDKSGKETSSEWSHYILQSGRDGHPRIRVALTRTK